MNYVVGVDIGGTFTDCVVVDEGGKVTIGKSLSTPADFAHGALNAANDAAQNVGLKNADELLNTTQLFFHACTIGDNTLITRAGAKTGPGTNTSSRRPSGCSLMSARSNGR